MGDGRVSLPRHCSNGLLSVSKAVCCHGCCAKHNCPQQILSLGFLTLQSSTRPLRCCVCKVPQSVVVATQSSRRPSELRVVCDTMLTGLGRQLRCCGVDVRLIDADASHDTAAKVTLGHLCLSLVCDKPLFIKTAQYIVLLPQMHDILGLFVWCWAVDYSVAWYRSLGGTVL